MLCSFDIFPSKPPNTSRISHEKAHVFPASPPDPRRNVHVELHRSLDVVIHLQLVRDPPGIEDQVGAEDPGAQEGDLERAAKTRLWSD